MRIDAFRFRHLGPFGAGGVAVDGLQPGLNVIAEHNERGKSSLLSGLELLLFKNHTSADARVKALSHAGDGTPEGEIDFTHAGRALRLVKRFRAGKTAELLDRQSGETLARRGEAEEMLAEMLGVRGKQQGPSGLLWVRQGTSMDGIADDGHVAARLETELSTLVGGDRARDYLARTVERLGALRTATGKPKKGGPIQTVTDALAAARSELSAARAAASAMRDTGRQLADVNRQLDALQNGSEDSDTERDIAEARAQLARARTAHAEVGSAEALTRRLALETQQAQDKLERFITLCAEADKLAEHVVATEHRLSALDAERTEARAALESANAALADMQEAQGRVAERAERRRARDQLVDRNAALQALLGVLEELETALAARDALAAEADALPAITKADLSELSRLERAVDAAETQLSRLETVLDLTLEAGVAAELDGQPIGSGAVRLHADSTLRLPGVGTIRLDLPEAQVLRSEAEQARARVAAAYARLEVESFEQAARAEAALADVQSELKLRNAEIALIAPDGRDTLLDRRAQLEADVERLSARLGDEDAGEDPQDAGALQQSLAEASGARNAAQARLSELDTEHATLRERLSATRRQLAALPSETHAEQRDAARSALAAEFAKTEARAEEAQGRLDTLRARSDTDPAMIEARLERLVTFARNRDSERVALQTRRAELDATRREAFERRDPDNEAKRLEGVVERLEDELARHERQADALTLLRDTLQSSQRALQDQYTAPVRRELLPLLRQVIDGADLALSEDLGATGLIRDGQSDALERLSGGTQEQIAVLTRLAFARLLARGGQPTPVILDDALVYADDARRGRMFDVLNYVSAGEDALQLLYLSCHADATARLGGHRLTLRDWPAQT